MEPVTTAALITAGASAGTSALSFMGGRKANEETLQSVREQMAFQERMDNSKHQRNIKDLKKAGLNPILSAYGGTAHAPAGASAKMENELTGSLVNADIGKKFADTKLATEVAGTEKKKQKLFDEQLKQAKVNTAAALNDHETELKHGKELGAVRKWAGAIGNILKGSLRFP